MIIPKGSTQTAIDRRGEIIEQKLTSLPVKIFDCPCLGSNVYLTYNGIKEIAHWAKLSYYSSQAAIDLPHQLKIAKFYASSKPKPGQRKRFGFVVMFELHGRYGRKTTKIMVGARRKGKHLQYCITAI